MKKLFTSHVALHNVALVGMLMMSATALFGQDNLKLLNVQETTSGYGVYPCGDRHEAMVQFVTLEPFGLTFESTHETQSQMNITVDSIAGKKTYSIVFVTQEPGRDYSNRRLTIRVPGFQDYRMPLPLKDKQLFEYTVSDPYSVLRSPFFNYLEKAQESFNNSEYQKAKDNTLKALSAEADGGFMFGAGSEGDFGVNAGIVYAMGMYCVGFDVLLKHFANGAKCQGGGKMGYHDFYGLGQVYGMLKGEMGVQLNLWFWKGRCSLIDVGLGALVQGGMPNPTWIYGKVKAKCKLLGGLFKFNKSVEFKAGKVCMPDYGDPLDNIEMFSNVEPGVKNNATEGYKKIVSPDLQPIFTTNYAMNHEVRLVDENMAQSGSGASYTQVRHGRGLMANGATRRLTVRRRRRS